MASYYRKFIPNYSSVTEPINRLLKKDTKFNWCTDCEQSFNKIIYLLTHPPLRFPNFKKRFILQTDASVTGLGAVLAQLDNSGTEVAIGYASRMLKPAEKNYSATELECLAIVWATEQFRPYLYGRDFDIHCDHNPLVYIDNMKNKSSRVTRWRLNLAEYTYKIIYKKGILNTNADALSRICVATRSSYAEAVKQASKIKETELKGILKNSNKNREAELKGILENNSINKETEPVSNDFKDFEKIVKSEQKKDKNIQKIIESLVNQECKSLDNKEYESLDNKECEFFDIKEYESLDNKECEPLDNKDTKLMSKKKRKKFTF
jgi:hypothetical protein